MPGHELVNRLLRRPFPVVRHRSGSERPPFEPISSDELMIVFWNDGLTVRHVCISRLYSNLNLAIFSLIRIVLLIILISFTHAKEKGEKEKKL